MSAYWLNPHPVLRIFLYGPEHTVFLSLRSDFLCAVKHSTSSFLAPSAGTFGSQYRSRVYSALSAGSSIEHRVVYPRLRSAETPIASLGSCRTFPAQQRTVGHSLGLISHRRFPVAKLRTPSQCYVSAISLWIAVALRRGGGGELLRRGCSTFTCHPCVGRLRSIGRGGLSSPSRSHTAMGV